MSLEKVKAKICCPVCRASHVPTQGQLTDGVYAATCQACGHFFKFRPVSQIRSTVSFTVNGKQYSVGNDVDLTTTLADFLREQRISMGTKFLCREGGCGMCVVETKLYEPVSEERKSYAVNSCLCPVFLCDGWEITTIEGLGNQRSGLHPIQDTLAGYNGSQCGFCSPAQIMNMYALLQQIPEPTQQQVEDIYDGITCRCTGYRSILDAMKSFAKPDDKVDKKCMADIEDLNGKLCKKTGQHCNGNCKKQTTSKKTLHMVLRDAQWLKPTSLDELYSMMKQYKDKSVRLTFGCSGWGVYKDIGPWMYDVLIDLHGIQELYNFSFDPKGQIGANVTLTQLIDIFEKVQGDDPDLPYLSECAQYMKQVAHTNVRNVGTWAGNLILKKLHPEFPSDVFLMMETVGVQVGLNDTDFVSPQQLLTTDLTEKVITVMVLPKYSANEIIKFYRVAKRTHSAHAYVNAGFRMNVDKANNFLVKNQPSIVFGGISKTFIHANKTEVFLKGKQLLDPNVIKNALLTLQLEIVPDSDPVDANPAYRRDLALAFFYRYVLYVLGDRVGSRLQSGSTPLVRSLSSGQQTYDTNKQEWPLTEPLQKLEAKAQVTGEAEYVNDIPHQPGELHAAFVISTVGNAKIQSIDASAALLLPNVLKVLTAKDIPAAGVNNCMPSPYVPEEVLCSGEVLYAGQAVALVIAENQVTADFAASLVKVTYSDIKPPILTIQDAVKAGSVFPKQADDVIVGNAEDAIAKSPKTVSGSVSVGTQFHFPMETQVSICTPTEDGMKVHATTQWTDYCQKAVALVLGIPSASIDVEVRRLGGAFGAKITKNFIVSAASALAAYVMKRPVRLLLNFHTNMEMMGKRFPYAADYQVGFDTTGKLNGVKITYYCDCGCSPNDCTLGLILNFGDNTYYCPNWHMIPVAVKTNSPSHTYCRAPGSTPGIFMMETIMEHIAKELGVDPTQVKTLNLYQKGQVTPGGMPLTYCSIGSVMSELEQMAEVQTRQQQIQTFNAANRWKKMGMSIVPIKYGIPWNGQNYGVLIAVFDQDGTVAVSHGGVEVGQGINTKVAQVVAYEFEIPVDMVKLKPTTSFISAGSGLTGSSVTSELCCQAAIIGCQQIKDRMAPVKAKMDKPTWLKVVKECFNEGIDLSAHAWFKADSPHLFQYNTYGTVCTEVELDVLTGDHQITRVDLLYDCGESMNPGLDIGQVEGAFVMGLGYWLTEECKYDPQSGQLLTNDTWEYKPPLHKDTPIDFRVNLLKNAPNPLGVLRAKACGEPPLCMSCSAVFALKHAIEAARKEIAQDKYFELNGPATVEALQMACLLDSSQFVIQ